MTLRRFPFPIRSLLALLAFLLITHPAAAQAPIEPDRLPANTAFYLLWRGAPAPAVRQANSLFALWDDKDLAPVRSALVENILSESKSDKSKQPLTREEIEEYSALIENPVLIGYASEPREHRRKNVSLKSTDGASSWNGIFFIYDRTGKEALLAKAILRVRSQEKEPPQISSVTLAGVTALKVEKKDGTTYWGDSAKYTIAAGEPRVFEEMVSRLNAKSSAGASLAEIPAYKEAQPVLAKGGLLEFFLRLPSLKEWAPEPKPGQPNWGSLLDSLRLEAIHSLCGSISLDGARTRFQGALFGDTSEGTLFDLWSNGDATFATAALAPTDAISYSETRVNLPGVYRTVRRAVQSLSPNGQQGTMDVVESALQSRIGMSLADALALFTGEFASVQTAPDLDDTKRIFALGIHQKTETLKLLRTLLSDRVTSERNEGTTTFLKISTHGGESSAGSVQWGNYHVAVTPNLVIGASRLDTLRAALAQQAHAGSSSALTVQPRYAEARARFPQTLNGISFFDSQRVDWDAVKTRLLTEMKKSAAKTPAGSKNNSAPQIPTWLERLNPQVFSRHLHTASSASWKDATGLRFDAWFD